MAAIASSTNTGSSPPAATGFLPALDLGSGDLLFTEDSVVISPKEEVNGFIAKSREDSRSPGPTRQDSKTGAPGILDRRKSARPGSGRSGSGDSVRRPRGKGLGPNIPIKVSSPATTMAESRNGMKSLEEDLTAGESSDAFEDAAESVQGTPSIGSEAPTRNGSFNKSQNGKPIGLGIDGHDMATPTHSRQVTAERVPAVNSEAPSAESSRPTSGEATNGLTLDQELESESSVSSVAGDSDYTPRLASHSRQVTAETAPALAGKSSEMELERNISLSTIRDGLRTHSRNPTAEAVPILPPPERERSMSPTKMESGQHSPTKTVRGLSGDIPLSSPPPPSSLGRIQALEQRNIDERPSSTSPSPQPGGLMRTASTRMGAFLGRMGSVRRPGKSPPAPGRERFTAERKNTSQSISSIGGDSLAPIADGPEDGDGEKVRPSLQDQFQNVRKQEEFMLSGSNGHLTSGDGEKTSTTRTASDAGISTVSNSDTASPEPRPSRASSTPNVLRSPPMNPSLPPGTASGLTAGPAEEPRPVDWDLWQALVNEGPSAVSKSSGEELSQAIASGIPACIRGVVWQVLAESKSAELENVYRTLKARGTTDADHLLPETPGAPPLSRQGSANNVHTIAELEEKESEISSQRSSVRSGRSTPATSNMASPPQSIQGDEQDLKAKLLAEKQKREAAALTKLEKAIKRDLGSRTSYSKFSSAAGLQDGLFGVCKAYALFDEGVGYAQGINFIAMPLLFNMTEEEAFTLLVKLMSKHDLRGMFTGDLAGLHLRLYQFERLLEDHDPALYCHLRRRNVGPQLYATQWFLTLFAYRFPLQLVTRVYDLFFSEGLTAILKFGLVLMQHNREKLLAMKDMGHLTNFLKEKLFDVYIDKSPSASSYLDSGFFGSVTGGADKELYRADEMVRDACEIKIDDSTLAQYTAEWEETQRQTHERDAELENLRTTSTTLSSRVKALEDRTQQQDAEHVAIASDLVRIKVENDTLLDENEGLKMKVEELQKVLDTQPAEIESTLKEEMDRILQRNSEVQSENRVLKEEQEEMESQLVSVKMQYAQVQESYDALSQKWGNVQAMLSKK